MEKTTQLNRKKTPHIVDAVNFDLDLPQYEKHTLKNGVEVYCFNMGTQETMLLNWVFYAGNWYEEKNLVAAATNFLLKNGTTTKSAFEINEHFEFYGAYLNRGCYNETSEISLHCLSKYIHELLPAVAELIADSTFPEQEMEIYKKNMQQKLQVNLKKSDFVAARLIESYLFGEHHPYGKYSQLEDYDKLNTEDVRRFFQQYYQSGKCIIFAAGMLPDNLIEQLELHFGNPPFQQKTFSFRDHVIQPAEQKKYRISNDPNGVQGSVRMARLFPNRHHPDFSKMQVLNNVFGGFFGSRLMDNIREDKGYTYGIYSYFMNHLQTGAFVISTEAGRDVCEATLHEVYKEMERICNELIPEEELLLSRNYLIGSILSDLDGPFQVASRWKNYILNGLTAQYFYDTIHTIKTITPKELQQLAQKYFNPDDFYELVVV